MFLCVALFSLRIITLSILLYEVVQGVFVCFINFLFFELSVCLDEIPPAYYLDRGFDIGPSKWIIFLEVWTKKDEKLTKGMREHRLFITIRINHSFSSIILLANCLVSSVQINLWVQALPFFLNKRKPLRRISDFISSSWLICKDMRISAGHHGA